MSRPKEIPAASPKVTEAHTTLLSDARQIIDTARANAVRSVDFNRVQMYWNLGRRIFEEEQHGQDRAEYGAYLTRNLAASLEPEYGSGFGVRQLEFCRQFYRIYPIANALRSQLNWTLPETNDTILAAEYRLRLPSEESLLAEMAKVEAEVGEMGLTRKSGEAE